MDVMKAPEQRHHVIGPVPPPIGVIHEEKGRDHSHPVRHGNGVQEAEMAVTRPSGESDRDWQHGESEHGVGWSGEHEIARDAAQRGEILASQREAPLLPEQCREHDGQQRAPERIKQRDSIHSMQTDRDETIIGIDRKGQHCRIAIRVSIIVPVLNEEAIIGPFLKNLRRCAPSAEIIVADGGSSDGTVELAREFCDHVVVSQRKSNAQMNAAAQLAHGDVLWFLHADSEVSNACLIDIENALADPELAGGYFRIRLPRAEFIYRVTDTAAHYAGLLFRVRCGDHGFFCRRGAFKKTGGYPDVPLMGDVEFYRALRRCGKVRVMTTPIVTSPRRYEQIGPWRLTAAYFLIASLYIAGAPLRFLARLYERMCMRHESRPV